MGLDVLLEAPVSQLVYDLADSDLLEQQHAYWKVASGRVAKEGSSSERRENLRHLYSVRYYALGSDASHSSRMFRMAGQEVYKALQRWQQDFSM